MGPRITNGRIRIHQSATPTLAGVSKVNDAGALAPVVFSDQTKSKTCKIRKIKSKGIPYPPKSTLANSMVVSVWIKNACTSRFEANSWKNPNYGKSSSGRSSLRTMAQILSMMSHDQIKTVSFDQNTQIIKIQIQENMIMYVHVWLDSISFNHGS